MTIINHHFQLFEIPVSFEIDLAELTDRYRLLQKAVHPDKFANSSDKERMLAVNHAAQVNDAFNTLKSPLLRAKYLLLLNDVVADDNATIADSLFLMQQMEMRESLEEAIQQIDAMSAVETVLDNIELIHRKLLDEIKEGFAQTSPNFIAINECVLKLKFFNRLNDEAELSLAKIENDDPN